MSNLLYNILFLEGGTFLIQKHSYEKIIIPITINLNPRANRTIIFFCGRIFSIAVCLPPGRQGYSTHTASGGTARRRISTSLSLLDARLRRITSTVPDALKWLFNSAGLVKNQNLSHNIQE